jgi:hypothetical protein
MPNDSDMVTPAQMLAMIHGIMQTQQQMMETQNKILETIAAPKMVQHVDVISKLLPQIDTFTYIEDDDDFSTWYNRYKTVFVADGKCLSDKDIVTLIIRKLGKKEHDLYAGIIHPNIPEEVNLNETVKTLTELFTKRKSLYATRCEFFTIKKEPLETYDAYTAKVNMLAERFKLASLSPEQFKCLGFISGLRDPADSDMKTRLLLMLEQKPEEVTLSNFREECNKYQRIRGEVHDEKKIVNKIDQKHNKQNNNKRRNNNNKSGKNSNDEASRPCPFCGAMHHVKSCNFNDHQCKKCNVVGHKEGYCVPAENFRNRFNNNKNTNSYNNNNRQQQQQHNQQSNRKSSKVNCITVNSVASKRKFMSITLNGKHVIIQLDTGSDITIINKNTWKQIGEPKINTLMEGARDYNGHSIEFIGTVNIPVVINNINDQADIHITDRKLNVLGLDLLHQFKLLNTPINKMCLSVAANSSIGRIRATLGGFCPRAFEPKIGKCTRQVSLTLLPCHSSIFIPARSVPYAMVEKVETELDRLESMGIITPVSYSEWAAPVVVVRKANGNIRLCADYSTGLNKQLQDHLYPVPVIDDIYARIGPKKWYSIIDIRDAYFQVEVDEQSRKFLTINTIKGLYTMNRLPQGIKPASALFQQLIESILAGIPNVFVYIDDIIVASDDESSHLDLLKKVISRIDENGFKLSMDKCHFLQKEIKCLGYIISNKGLSPDPAKVEAITKMPAPSNVSELRSVIGSINYYQRFIPNMATLRRPLDNLLKKDADFKWSKDCEDAFNAFKGLLIKVNLCHYNPNLPLILATDASHYGIGATLMHRFPNGTTRAIAYASRTLSPAEKNYSQIEKEGLAIVWGTEKYHKYLCGRKFELHTDHEPLLSIFGAKKGVSTRSASRLLRWGLRLNAYDFDIKFVDTKSFGYADVLSRLICKSNTSLEDTVIATIQARDELAVVNAITNDIPLSYDELKQATNDDITLQLVKQYIIGTWPSSVTGSLLEFKKRRNQLSINSDIIMFGDRVVIPTALQSKILDALHSFHMGMSATKSLARSHVYYPGLDNDIEWKIKNCSKCIVIDNAPRRHVLHSWPKPIRPFERIHVDYASKNGANYLLIVDAYSKFPEITKTSSMTSSATIKILDEYITRYGLPDTIVSDNGPQFVSSEFAFFLGEKGIQHITIAPYHPNSNGQAERFVQSLKKALDKMQDTPTDTALNKFLLSYRITPNTNTPGHKAPAEIVFGRIPKTSFDLLRPPTAREMIRNEAMEHQFNAQHHAVERVFQPQDRIKFRSQHRRNNRWQLGTILERIGNSLYNVCLDSNKSVTRAHADQLILLDTPATERNSSPLPLHMLLEEFDMLDEPAREADEEVESEPIYISSDESFDSTVDDEEEEDESIPAEESFDSNITVIPAHEREEILRDHGLAPVSVPASSRNLRGRDVASPTDDI